MAQNKEQRGKEEQGMEKARSGEHSATRGQQLPLGWQPLHPPLPAVLWDLPKDPRLVGKMALKKEASEILSLLQEQEVQLR